MTKQPGAARVSELRKLLAGSSSSAWGPVLAERVHLRLCNRRCVIGLKEAVAELDLLFSKVARIGYGFLDIWSTPSGAVIETDLTPLRPDPKHASVPCAIIVHQDDAGRLVDVRFYFDPAPVFRRVRSPPVTVEPVGI